jgi:MFS transporter, DHA1 family, multidrug resistance protein
MSPKLFLVLMTAVAVVSDSLLHPFYPQYLSEVFGVTSPQHVGAYIAACSLTVLLTFPFWARLAKRIHVLRLLIATQIATGVLSLVCYILDSLVQFWCLSLLMMVFKASYLLIYPYALSQEEQQEHITTISLLAFVVYFGNILSALLSGTVFELVHPRFLFILMAAGDVLQILLCLFLLRLPVVQAEQQTHATSKGGEPGSAAPRTFVYKLGAVMFVLYFSAYLTEPFFSSYWERSNVLDNKILTGTVFAIPGVAALCGLYVNSRKNAEPNPYNGILPAIILTVVGLFLEVSGNPWLLVLGRFVYGWGLFQSMVRLDLALFQLGSPDSYATDFSIINAFQGLGTLVASFAAGALVLSYDLRLSFIVAAAGFAAGVVLYFGLLRRELKAEPIPSPSPEALRAEGTTA